MMTTVRSSRTKDACTPFEIKSIGDNPAGLVDRVGQLVQINFRNNVK